MSIGALKTNKQTKCFLYEDRFEIEIGGEQDGSGGEREGCSGDREGVGGGSASTAELGPTALSSLPLLEKLEC